MVAASDMTLRTMHNLGNLLMTQGKLDEAEPLFAELYRRTPGVQVDPKDAAQFMCGWGLCLSKLGRRAEAEPALREAQRRLTETGQAASKPMQEVLAHLGEAGAGTQPPTSPTTAPATRPDL